MRPPINLICLAVLLVILTAGLWPFNPFPANDVHWLTNENGLLFGAGNGLVLSSGPIPTPDAPYGSLEIWLEPSTDKDPDPNAFLSFYTPHHPNQLSLWQYKDTLEVQHGTVPKTKTWVGRALRQRKSTFITLTSGAKGTALYINGLSAGTAPHLELSAKDFSGEVVLGTSPRGSSPWAGKMRGLAIYDRELTSDDVWSHYNVWTTTGRTESLEQETVALYKFNERAGNVVHNKGKAGPDLQIPTNFKAPKGKPMSMPWGPDPSGFNLPDIGVNITGFIPFGFFFCAWFSTIRRNSHPILATIVLGALISFGIESLQKYLPTRDPDLTDVMTNILGSAVGAVLYQWKGIRKRLGSDG